MQIACLQSNKRLSPSELIRSPVRLLLVLYLGWYCLAIASIVAAMLGVYMFAPQFNGLSVASVSLCMSSCYASPVALLLSLKMRTWRGLIVALPGVIYLWLWPNAGWGQPIPVEIVRAVWFVLILASVPMAPLALTRLLQRTPPRQPKTIGCGGKHE
jgi:hypothetical protein